MFTFSSVTTEVLLLSEVPAVIDTILSAIISSQTLNLAFHDLYSSLATI